MADTLRLITEDESVPVLIHCAHGKDRTGLIIAVILGCLDVDDEIIVEDYALSEVCVEGVQWCVGMCGGCAEGVR